MQQISKTTTTVSPVGGLNTFDPISSMPDVDAISMINVYPTSYGVHLRKGSRLHADLFQQEVKTMMAWKDHTGNNKIFAVDDDGIYDISVAGDVSGTPDINTTNGWLQHTQLGNAAGNHLIAFNGQDDGFWYSSLGWQRLSAGDGIVNGTWSGVDPADLIHCTQHQKRVWAVEKDSTMGWYLPPNQLYGVAVNFDFGPLFSDGGYLQALTTWTHDGGAGPDDYLLAISSSGQVAVYRGIDPSSADTWEMVGVYYIGPTFTRRCFAKYGGDVVMLTQYGIVSMNSLSSAQSESVLVGALSRKVQSYISRLTVEGADRMGWQLQVYSPDNMLIVNIPGILSSQNQQLVLNTVHGSWATFSNQPAVCWMTDIDTLYYGMQGKIYRAWEGNNDQADYDNLNGTPIVGTVQQAFSNFGAIGNLKHFKLVRPTFIASNIFRYDIVLNVDYTFDGVSGSGDFPERSDGGLWDDGLFDSATWSGASNIINDWLGVTGMGFVASLLLRIESESEVIWTSTDWVFEIGGPI